MEALVPGPPQTSQIRVEANAAGLPGVTCCSQQVRGWRLPLETQTLGGPACAQTCHSRQRGVLLL